MEICGDNRFEIIAKAKADLLEGTNIETDEAEMAVIDNILFRCWQMGWLDRYDRKTEPLDKDINVRSKTMRDCYNCKRYENDCECVECHYEPKTETQPDCYMCKWLGEVDVCGRCRNRNLFAEADTEPQTERPCDNCQEFDCYGCEYKQTERSE